MISEWSCDTQDRSNEPEIQLCITKIFTFSHLADAFIQIS